MEQEDSFAALAIGILPAAMAFFVFKDYLIISLLE